MDLFQDSHEAQPKSLLNGLKISEEYAAAYEARKRGAELKKLKAELGDAAESGDEDDEGTEYSSEDSDAELATPAVDAAIFRTLAKIKQRDASIYDGSRNVFEEEERAAPSRPSTSKTAKADKPTRLKDFQRQQLLAGGADEDTGRRSAIRTPAQESEDLRKEVTTAFQAAVESDEDADDGLLVPRLRTANEIAADDAEYRSFLAAQGADDAEDVADEGEAFLRDYILNRAWLDKGKARATHPTHDEVLEQIDDDEDAAFEEHAEQFEHAYNFRFEDPVQGAAGQVVGHSRQPAASVRKTDDSRKIARENKKRLKELKKAEALAKLQELSKMAGGEVKGLESYDLDADFDPEEHDRQMQGAFDQDWYAEDEPGVDEDGKPTWDQDIDIEDIVGPEPEERFDEPEDDAYDPSAPVEKPKKKKRKHEDSVAASTEASTSTGKKRKRSKLDELLDEDVPYAQIIGGGFASRFRYETVAPMTYGLTPAEILMATDAELNSVASLRRLATFRDSDSGKRNRRALQELRDRLKQRRWGDDAAGYEDQRPLKMPKASKPERQTVSNAADGVPKKRLGKKRRQKEARKLAAQTAGSAPDGSD